MKHTTNYNLNKIELTDSPPDITALNPNFDTIDTQLKARADKDTEIVASIDKVKNDYLPKSGGNVTGNLTVKSKRVAVSVNGSTADANGNITIDVGGKVQSVNGVTPDANGNVAIEFGGGDVQSVDGVEPDAEGNVALNASTRDEILEGAMRVTDVEVDASVATHEGLQTAVARMESNVDSKLPNTTVHIVETWENGKNWYRVWSDGWIEQGGQTEYMLADTTGTVQLVKPMTTTTYTVNVNSIYSGTSIVSGVYYTNVTIKSRTTTNFVVSNDAMQNDGLLWYACGY